MTTSSISSSSGSSPTGIDSKDNEKEMVKVRGELPFLFEMELTVKQNKRIYVVDEFVATERVTPIEGKFYSKFNNENIKKNAQRQCYWELAEKCRNESRMKNGFPVLESQSYGWMPSNQSMIVMKEINRVEAPKRRCTMTVYGEKLLCERVTERPTFTGKQRFFLS